MHRLRSKVRFHAVLGSYVDNAFGGARSASDTQLMVDTLTLAGKRTQTFINPKKTEGPARSLVILGLLYCSISRTCRLGESKRRKYLARIREAIEQPVTTDQLETLAGNLGFAAWVEPFCRPLLIWIYAEINQDRPRPSGHLPPHARAALRVWHRVIHRNRGLSFEYIMNRFPAVRSPIFVDASTSWGSAGSTGSSISRCHTHS